MRKYRTWREYLIKQLAANWDEALDYIQFAIEEYQVDGDTEVFLLALYTFVESQGGVTEIAKHIGMDPQTLTKVLSSENAPRVDTLRTILTALGCRLSIEPLKPEDCGAEHAGVDDSVAPIKDARPEMAPATDNK